MGRGQITLVLWVKERSSRTVTKTPRMHQNSPFWEPPPQTLPPVGRRTPPPHTPHPTPLGASIRFSRLRLSPRSAPTAPRSSSPHLSYLQIPPYAWSQARSIWRFSPSSRNIAIHRPQRWAALLAWSTHLFVQFSFSFSSLHIVCSRCMACNALNNANRWVLVCFARSFIVLLFS